MGARSFHSSQSDLKSSLIRSSLLHFLKTEKFDLKHRPQTSLKTKNKVPACSTYCRQTGPWMSVCKTHSNLFPQRIQLSMR